MKTIKQVAVSSGAVLALAVFIYLAVDFATPDTMPPGFALQECNGEYVCIDADGYRPSMTRSKSKLVARIESWNWYEACLRWEESRRLQKSDCWKTVEMQP